MTIFSVQFKILGNGISQSFTLSLKSGHPPFMLATHLNLTVKRKKFGLTLSINYFFHISIHECTGIAMNSFHLFLGFYI